MTIRRPVALFLTLLALLAALVFLRTPALVTAQGTPGQGRPNPGFPHQDSPAPVVLALDVKGVVRPVSEATPVPVDIPTPMPITTTTPLAVNDGGQIITATGNYRFMFANEVLLPGLPAKVEGLDVTVTQISGKWVTASYTGAASIGARVPLTIVFNTEQLLSRPISTHSATKMLPS
jgi:hypothetical protein